MANKIANRAVMCGVLKEAASQDKNVLVLCSGSKGSASLSSFAGTFPAQFAEAGIAEQNLVSIAAGLASMTARPQTSNLAAIQLRMYTVKDLPPGACLEAVRRCYRDSPARCQHRETARPLPRWAEGNPRT